MAVARASMRGRHARIGPEGARCDYAGLRRARWRLQGGPTAAAGGRGSGVRDAGEPGYDLSALWAAVPLGVAADVGGVPFGVGRAVPGSPSLASCHG